MCSDLLHVRVLLCASQEDTGEECIYGGILLVMLSKKIHTEATGFEFMILHCPKRDSGSNENIGGQKRVVLSKGGWGDNSPLILYTFFLEKKEF